MKTLKLAFTAILATAVMLFATTARADWWAWSYTNGSDLTASGMFTTVGDASSPEAITGITGTRNGAAILGIVPLLADPGFSYNNLFSAAAPYVDVFGDLYKVEGLTGNVNVYFQDGALHDYTYSGLPGGTNDHIVRMTVQHVPEPGSLALFGLGAIGLLASRRKGTKDNMTSTT